MQQKSLWFLEMHVLAEYGIICMQRCAHAVMINHKAAQMLLHSLPHGLVKEEFSKHTQAGTQGLT